MSLLRACLSCRERNPTAIGSKPVLCLSPFSRGAITSACLACCGSCRCPGQVLANAPDAVRAPDALDDEHLLHYAAALGLDTERFKWELQNHVFVQRVNEDAESGRHSRVSGTPTFFINGIRHDDTYTLDVLLPAVRSYENPHCNL